jgi:hypothetical protein
MNDDYEIAKKIIESQRPTEIILERIKKTSDSYLKKKFPPSKKEKAFYPEVVPDDGAWRSLSSPPTMRLILAVFVNDHVDLLSCRRRN